MLFLAKIISVSIIAHNHNKKTTLSLIGSFLFRFFKNNIVFYSWLVQALSKLDSLNNELEVLELGIKNNPQSVNLVWGLINTLCRLGNYREAKEYLLELLDTDKYHDIDEVWLANIYGLLAKTNLYLDDIKSAQQYISLSLNLAPWNLDACKTQTECFLKLHEHENIVSYLNEYIDKYPDLYPPYVWIADYYNFHSKDFTNAIKFYKTALHKSLNNRNRNYSGQYLSVSNLTAGCVTDLYALYLRIGDSGKALATINDYMASPYKDTIISNELLIDFYIYSKAYDKAHSLLKRLLLFHPQTHEYWALLAKLCAENQRFDEAEKHLNKALCLNQSSFTAINIASEIYMMKQDWASAKKVLQILIKKFPMDTEYQDNMRICLEHLEEKPTRNGF